MKVNIQLVKKAELASTGEKKNPKRQNKTNKTKIKKPVFSGQQRTEDGQCKRRCKEFLDS